MFYVEDDSEDEEEKVHEDSLSKTQGIYHGKAPSGILVSSICIHVCSLASLLSLDSTETRGHPQKWLVLFLWKLNVAVNFTNLRYAEQKLATCALSFAVCHLSTFSNSLPRKKI